MVNHQVQIKRIANAIDKVLKVARENKTDFDVNAVCLSLMLEYGASEKCVRRIIDLERKHYQDFDIMEIGDNCHLIWKKKLSIELKEVDI